MNKRKYIVLLILALVCIFFYDKNNFVLEKKVWADFDNYLKKPNIKIADYTNFNWDYLVFIRSDEMMNQDYFFVRNGRVVYQNQRRYDNIESENNDDRLKFNIDEASVVQDNTGFYQLKKYESAVVCNQNAVITLKQLDDEKVKNLIFLMDSKNCHLVKSPLQFIEYGVMK